MQPLAWKIERAEGDDPPLYVYRHWSDDPDYLAIGMGGEQIAMSDQEMRHLRNAITAALGKEE